MIVWRTGTQLVLERGAGVFWVIDETGKVARHQPQTSTADDDLYQVTFVVRDGQLIEHTFIQGPYVSTPHTDVVLASGLVIDDEPSTLDYVRTILGDEDIKTEERSERQRREGDARIASIAGAEEDYHHLGYDFERAQRALIARVHAYDDKLHIALLKTLIDLARARPAPSETALASFVRGCLLACFTPNPPEPISVNDDEAINKPPLAEALAMCARELDEVAEGQEYVDANLNAAQYWRAAKAVRAAIGTAAAKQ